MAAEAARRFPVYKVVLTGGPCAGKTTAMARLSTFLRERGFRVYTVPEAATMLFSNGATFADLDDDGEVAFQLCLLRTQMHLEDMFETLARHTMRPSVLLCDRGAMDGSAYISGEQWEVLLERAGKTNVELRDARYNAVFHMVTAARGAADFYTLENNSTRTESVEEAISVDARLLKAWVGHPKLEVFDNDGVDFESKLGRMVDAMSRLVGLPASQRTFRRFLLAAPPDYTQFPVAAEVFTVEKVYLLNSSPDTLFSFVRRRQQGALSVYGQTTVRLGADGQQLELKRIIRRREYVAAAAHRADPSRHVVRLTRASFLWEEHYFEVYQYLEPVAGVCLLNVQARSAECDVPLPPFVSVLREVTGSPEFSAHTLSLKETAHADPDAPHLRALMNNPLLRRTVSAEVAAATPTRSLLQPDAYASDTEDDPAVTASVDLRSPTFLPLAAAGADVPPVSALPPLDDRPAEEGHEGEGQAA